jgi:hypothetical protein
VYHLTRSEAQIDFSHRHSKIVDEPPGLWSEVTDLVKARPSHWPSAASRPIILSLAAREKSQALSGGLECVLHVQCAGPGESQGEVQKSAHDA